MEKNRLYRKKRDIEGKKKGIKEGNWPKPSRNSSRKVKDVSEDMGNCLSLQHLCLVQSWHFNATEGLSLCHLTYLPLPPTLHPELSRTSMHAKLSHLKFFASILNKDKPLPTGTVASPILVQFSLSLSIRPSVPLVSTPLNVLPFVLMHSKCPILYPELTPIVKTKTASLLSHIKEPLP